MVFDGDCGFCRVWIEYWKQLTGDHIAYAPYQEVADRFPDTPREKFAAAVQLILPSGEVHSGAQAVFTALADGAGRKTPLWIYAHIPGAAAISEAAYRVIARRRSAAYTLTKLLWGLPVRPESNALVRWLFLRVLGAILIRLPFFPSVCRRRD